MLQCVPIWCCKYPTQLNPCNKNITPLIWMQSAHLDWSDLPLHYCIFHLWNPLHLAVSLGHVLLLHFPSISSSFVFLSPSSHYFFPPFSPSLYKTFSSTFPLHNPITTFILQVMMRRMFTQSHPSMWFTHHPKQPLLGCCYYVSKPVPQ